jgi:hypothetical protein
VKILFMLTDLSSTDRSAGARGNSWSEPAIISQAQVGAGRQDVAADRQGNLHVVWDVQTDGEGNSDMLSYARWDGNTWTKPVDIFYSPGQVHIPAVAADSEGVVHGVWVSGYSILYSPDTIAPPAFPILVPRCPLSYAPRRSRIPSTNATPRSRSKLGARPARGPS